MKTLTHSIFLAFTLLSLMACSHTNNSPSSVTINIDKGWQFSESDKNEWLDAEVPGCIHTDLLNHDLIKDPFYRLNEHDLQWIDKKDWVYQTTFNIDKYTFNKERISLNFAGLDTYADVYLNNELILKADNMFRGWTVDCKKYIKEGDNKLRIYFHSPIKVGLDIYDNYPYVVQSSANDLAKIGQVPGEKWVSPHVRKAPYQFGWDWGPRLVTSGIWEPITLKAWNTARLDNIHTNQLDISETVALLNSVFEIEAQTSENAELSIFVNNEELSTKKVQLQEGLHTYKVDFEIENPKRWWSNGLGDAHLYKVKGQLKTKAGIETFEHTLGLRTIELVREDDETGRSFYFKLNGQPVFMKGANYIPNDVFLDRVSPEKYEHIIKSAADCHFNMLRVWGGGIYEKEIFYALCDKYGILVWQDFMFACNMYPGHPEFLESVKHEAEYNVRRLRNHPSIALWCGNNEILAAWFGWGWKEDNEKKQPDGAKAMWQAYKDIFLDVLPKAVQAHDPIKQYWASSPQAEDTIRTNKIDGDEHDWRIWFQDVPFITYHDGAARFVSEYGFQSFPELKTVKKYTIPEDYDINSEVMKSHQRSFIGNGAIKRYMDNYYRNPKDFESFLYVGLLLQAEGIRTGIEGHRINMPTTMGSLYWQLNDVWPVASWSSIDYFGNWKALQYFTRKAFAPIIAVPDTKTDDLLVYSVSDNFEDKTGHLELTILDFEGKELWSNTNNITVKANTSNIIFKKSLQKLLKGINTSNAVLSTKLFIDNQLTYSTTSYFKEAKDLSLPQPQVSSSVKKVDKGYEITVSTDKLAKNLYLSYNEAEGWYSDNYFDLLPGQSKTIVFETKEIIEDFNSKLLIRTLDDTY
ncbi:glycoside hydrolase family 2 protein [Carboxylicivirga sp. A043]|uniref:glycoside hydrolase family 2 protein n=1 Tax=Carboxylicivirga litoralis TaxID=2816963 RepID=UPI0021CB6390|nr:glycoside hydrolase family 2 protein [Carboxylicivirga sp. A043]MCU4157970.1 glycoside hydrolase family 2 protein [Carboxylicivirga sp. A043]